MSERDFPRRALDDLIQSDRPVCYGVLKPGIEDPHGIPLVRIVDIESSELRSDGLFRITPALDKEFGRSRIDAGDLLLSIQGTVGRVAIVPPEAAGANISRTIARLSFAAEGDATFYKHWFLSNDGLRAIEGAIVGTTRSSLNIGVLRRVAVPSPDGPEKAKIAEVLDTLDSTIRQTEAIIEKLKQVKQGLLHDLLTRGIDANGELRPPQSQAPHLYKDSPLGWIPREWMAESIDEACSDVVDCPHSTPNFLDDGVLVARTMHIKAGVFLKRLASRVSEDEYKVRIARLRPEPGDVVFTREAPVGEAFVIPVGMRVCLGQRVMLLRPRPEKARGQFLIAQIYSGAVADRIAALTAGTTNPHLNVAEVRQFILPLPPVHEQTVIEQQLGSLDDRIALVGAEREKLLIMKSGLMDNLLTGHVRVTPLLQSEAAP